MLCSGNLILCRLARCCDASIYALAAKFHVEPHDVVCSSAAPIKDSVWFYFSKLVSSVLCLFVSFFACFIVYFIVHAAFVRIKLMTMMIIRSLLSLGFPVVMLCVRGMLMSLPVRAYLSANVW